MEQKDISKFIVVGDRVLIKPKEAQSRTESGLYLPPNIKEKEKIHSGYVIKTGPGYPIPSMNADEEEFWKKTDKRDEARYIPLQAKEGDLAIYLQRQGFEVEFDQEKYMIVPHSAILMLVRDEALFE